MKKLYIFCLVIVLVGCEKELQVVPEDDDISYFACIDYDFDPDVESVLYINHSRKIIKVAKLEWDYFYQDEQIIFSGMKGNGYHNFIDFNFVTGKLNITISNYFAEDSMMADLNGVTNYYYQCKKTESML